MQNLKNQLIYLRLCIINCGNSLLLNSVMNGSNFSDNQIQHDDAHNDDIYEPANPQNANFYLFMFFIGSFKLKYLQVSQLSSKCLNKCSNKCGYSLKFIIIPILTVHNYQDQREQKCKYKECQEKRCQLKYHSYEHLNKHTEGFIISIKLKDLRRCYLNH